MLAVIVLDVVVLEVYEDPGAGSALRHEGLRERMTLIGGAGDELWVALEGAVDVSRAPVCVDGRGMRVGPEVSLGRCQRGNCRVPGARFGSGSRGCSAVGGRARGCAASGSSKWCALSRAGAAGERERRHGCEEVRSGPRRASRPREMRSPWLIAGNWIEVVGLERAASPNNTEADALRPSCEWALVDEGRAHAARDMQRGEEPMRHKAKWLGCTCNTCRRVGGELRADVLCHTRPFRGQESHIA